MISKTLSKANDIIHGERQDQYGNPEDSFEIIARYWTTYLIYRHQKDGKNVFTLDSADVAIMMTLLKVARMSGQTWQPDNAVDGCGYLAILNDRIKGQPED